MSDSNIFNAKGMLRSDLENVRVPADRQGVLDALVAAVKTAEAGEASITLKDAAVTAAVKVLDTARAKCPQSTFLDEWKRSVHGAASADGVGGLPPSAAQAAIEAARKAEVALDTARHEARQAKSKLADARARVGIALAAYTRAVPTITPEQNIRQHLASNQAERARRAAEGTLPYRPTLTQTARAMAGGGYGSDIRTRRGGGPAYRRGPDGTRAYTRAQAMDINAQRIRAARPKLPSER
jgi:hypothetical protein